MADADQELSEYFQRGEGCQNGTVTHAERKISGYSNTSISRTETVPLIEVLLYPEIFLFCEKRSS